MKRISIVILSLIALITFSACEHNDDVVFIAQPDPEGISFTNTFLSEYVLTQATAGNVAERFVWNTVDMGVPTNITYEVQGSATADFATPMVMGTTTETNLAVSISKFLALAEEAGLDNDPNSANPNEGQLYFRVRAYAGNGGTENLSEAVTVSVVLPEATGNSGVSLSTWGVVGSGYNNWGAFADSPFYTTPTAGVFVAYVTLLDGEIKFRENNDWGNNYGDDGADGSLEAGGANIIVTAGNYKITLDLNANTYTMENFSWGVVGSGYNDWGNNGPDAKFFYDYTTDSFKVGVKLINGEIKFRKNNDWTENFGDTGVDGTLDAGGDNIAVTAGYYLITLDFNNNSYSIESSDIWGVVGSAYNNWGATPDFSMTEVNPGVWIADGITLLDGEYKFRVNEDWGVNFGDDGADGSLEAGGANIAATAGKYVIVMDLNDSTYTVGKQQ